MSEARERGTDIAERMAARGARLEPAPFDLVNKGGAYSVCVADLENEM
jgi:hypothetical protein